ncbi:hypothetical protein JXR01_02995 [Candidatus Kaiserbacteria bacterium]|nr:MAG: hypothetical protein JXR01_02995 [Candidatus Kaiserbacteria bacterium]
MFGRKQQKVSEVPNVWGGYISMFRPEIMEVASQMSRKLYPRIKQGFSIQTRYISWNGKVELYIGDEVLARVVVEGECSTPSTMIVETNLSSEYEALFREAMRFRGPKLVFCLKKRLDELS